MSENSFDNTLDSILNSNLWKIGTSYMEMKTAEEVKENNENLILAENASKDKLYNAIANIPANQPIDSSFNIVNSWNSLSSSYKLIAGAGLLAGLYFVIRK